MKNENPFLINQYIRPKFLFGRTEETNSIIEILHNSNNVQLLGKNGIGKTSLIKNVFYYLSKNYEITTIYLNLIKIKSIQHFLHEFTILKLHTISEKKGKKLRKEIYSGLQNNSNPFVNLNNEELKEKFKLFFKSFDESMKFVIALDNFQVVKSFPLNIFEDLFLKSVFDKQNLNLILSGTKQIGSFDQFKTIELKKISAEDTRKFILKQFDELDINISEKAIAKIIELSKGDMILFQSLCSRLVEENIKNVKSKKIQEILDKLVLESSHYFESQKSLFSPYQWKLLCAIGSEGEAVQVTSGSFISLYQLNAPSSVKTALDALLEKEMIFKNDNYYSITNSLFGYWLQKLT